MIACAQEQEPARRANTLPKIEQVSEGVLNIGGVTLDKNTKTVKFPGTLNMDKGMLEYLIVEEGGKTHESLLATRIEPYHLHVAMLLLGAKVDKNSNGQAPPDAINMQYLKTAPKPKGDSVIIRVRWSEAGKPVVVNAEDLVFNDEKHAPMTRGPWVYNGSMLVSGLFLAQQDRVVAALVIDPTALINNTRPGCDNDQIWSVRSDKAPKAGTPVEISIQLQATQSQ
jgi:hypothetical protein